jgi:hypothetical protein
MRSGGTCSSPGRTTTSVERTLLSAAFDFAFDFELKDHHRPGVPLDKSEGGVKDKNILSVFFGTVFCQRGLRTKTLEISR